MNKTSFITTPLIEEKSSFVKRPTSAGFGVETYVQENLRVFPQSNSAKDVREHFLNSLNKVKFVRENALRVNILENGFSVVTDMGAYKADYVVISTGGHSTFDLIKMLGHKILGQIPQSNS